MVAMILLELFSGIGSQTQALKNIGIKHTSICCEYEDYIHKAYESLHGPTNNLGDISLVTDLPYCDILTYSFPCQDLSIIGNKNGLAKGSGTRSSLLWEVQRLLDNSVTKNQKLPKVLILENVKQLVSQKNLPHFNEWISYLSSIGYKTSWKVINSVNVGIPQKRERIFAISCLDKEIQISSPQMQCHRLEDVMLSDSVVRSEYGNRFYFSDESMRTKIYKAFQSGKISSINASTRIYGTNSITHALTTYGSTPCAFGGILYSNQTQSDIKWKKHVYGMSYDDAFNYDLGIDKNSIRLATPHDYMRMMGFGSRAYLTLKCHFNTEGYSLNNIYHVAGNSIVVPVLEHIFRDILNQTSVA